MRLRMDLDIYVVISREAKRLLLEGNESITSIAYLAGYKHPSSFSREFKKVFGYGPKEFGKGGGY